VCDLPHAGLKVKIYRSIGLNFIGNAWNGLLIVTTTPWYLAMLGVERYGLVGFWQVLLYVFLVLDWGLGATLVREFARLQGERRGRDAFSQLLHWSERICLPSAVLITVGLASGASWLATDWLQLNTVPVEVGASAIAWMSVSAGVQLMYALYLNGLAGLQRHGAMNLIQILGYSLRYLGGGLVLLFSRDLGMFFAFQGVCMLALAILSRAVLRHAISTIDRPADNRPESIDTRRLWRFATGMFVTSVLGMLLTNTDRLVLSRLVAIEDFGRYSLAITAASFLQMIVFAFYRPYYPMFSELAAHGDKAKLHATYLAACRAVGALVVPVTVLGWMFAPELIRIWLGQPDDTTAALFRWLIVGVSLAGLMWLPAAYQQANGWTRLHVGLMALALALGLPVTIFLVQHAGVQGGVAMMLLHGGIQISLGLLLMNRVYFPGKSQLWYGSVLIRPLILAILLGMLFRYWMPQDLSSVEEGLWILGASAAVLIGSVIQQRDLLFRRRTS
jgi:O-antigen/teichoic acid export membrane protein